MENKELQHLTPGEIALKFPEMKEEFQKLNLPYALMDCEEMHARKDVIPMLEKIQAYARENRLEVPEQKNCSEMVRFILATFHKREREFIAETRQVISELDDDILSNLVFAELHERWEAFAKHHLEHFREEEKFVFADLLKCDIYDDPEMRFPKMQFGSLSRPFMDLEKDHEESINNLGRLTEDLLMLTETDKRFNLIWLNTKRLYLSVQDHIHYENYVLYPAVLKLEAALCY